MIASAIIAIAMPFMSNDPKEQIPGSVLFIGIAVSVLCLYMYLHGGQFYTIELSYKDATDETTLTTTGNIKTVTVTNVCAVTVYATHKFYSAQHNDRQRTIIINNTTCDDLDKQALKRVDFQIDEYRRGISK